jgi:nucleotidyltransferase-like protein
MTSVIKPTVDLVGRALDELAVILRRAVLRTGTGPLRPLWWLLHGGVMHGIAQIMRWKRRDSTLYLKGSFAHGDPVYGISDIDMIFVVPDDPRRAGENRERARRRWERLRGVISPLRYLVQHFWIYEDAELAAATSSTCLTYGLESSSSSNGPAEHLGSRPLVDEMGLLAHPPLFGPERDWLLLAGRDRRPAGTVPDAQDRRIAGWLGLQYLWWPAYLACLQPNAPHVPFLCVKFVADPVRIWLWMARGEQVLRRRDVLERGLVALPEEEHALRRALELLGALPRSPKAPLGEFLPFLVRLSARIADRIAADLAEDGITDVRLVVGKEADLAVPDDAGTRLRQLLPSDWQGRRLPLVDWRALVSPLLPDETFLPIPGDPSDPGTVRAAVRVMDRGQYAALRAHGLLFFPVGAHSLLRTVQCAITDPVSFAVADGRPRASFPDVRGWAASDCARRAVAEHRAWLQSRPAGDGLGQLGRLMTAARAGLFLESLEAGDPELALPVGAVAERLAARDSRASSAATDAGEMFRTCRRDNRTPPASLIVAMDGIVRRLPAYAADR